MCHCCITDMRHTTVIVLLTSKTTSVPSRRPGQRRERHPLDCETMAKGNITTRGQRLLLSTRLMDMLDTVRRSYPLRTIVSRRDKTKNVVLRTHDIHSNERRFVFINRRVRFTAGDRARAHPRGEGFVDENMTCTAEINKNKTSKQTTLTADHFSCEKTESPQLRRVRTSRALHVDTCVTN